MKVAILDAVGKERSVGDILKNLLAKSGAQISHFNLQEMSILPCRSCGSCGIRTPGVCVQKDDMVPIFQAIANCELLVYLTPVRFGGYSSQLKKVIDRLMLLGMPFYIVKRGHLLHPMRYGRKFILGIGISENGQPDEDNNFRLLVSRNAVNLSSDYTTLVLDQSAARSQIEAEINRVLCEVK